VIQYRLALARQPHELYVSLSTLLFVIVTGLVLVTFRHYGASWDEQVQHEYGEAVLRFYSSLFRDRSATALGDLSRYGGFIELLEVFATRISPFDVYATRHLLDGLCGVAGIFACWKIARFLAGLGSAFWTALLLALYPSYYGHMFVNSKDIPFAVFYVWSLYYLIRILHEFPGISITTAGKFGIVSGLAMAVRVGGLLLLCYLYLFVGLFSGYLLWSRRKSLRSIRSRKTVLILFTTSGIAYALMLLFWPYALAKPFVRPFLALEALSYVKPAAASWNYVPLYLLLKLPELVLALGFIGIVLASRAVAKKIVWVDLPLTLSYLVLVFAFLFPVIYAIIKRPFLYDEIRHFLFVIPPLFCLIGITMDRVLRWSFDGKFMGKYVVAMVIVYLLFHIRLMVLLHPYEYAYYNRFIGGVYGAYRNGYDPEYWGTSYKEAVTEVENFLRARDGSQFANREYKILLGPAEWCATYYFPQNFLVTAKASDADIYLSTTRDKSDKKVIGSTILTVGRLGAPFTIAKAVHPVGH
jgi:hypothetical protein